MSQFWNNFVYFWTKKFIWKTCFLIIWLNPATAVERKNDKLQDRWLDYSSMYSIRNTSTKIGTIQRRLAWPLRKDDTQNRKNRVQYKFLNQDSTKKSQTKANKVWKQKIIIKNKSKQSLAKLIDNYHLKRRKSSSCWGNQSRYSAYRQAIVFFLLFQLFQFCLNFPIVPIVSLNSKVARIARRNSVRLQSN